MRRRAVLAVSAAAPWALTGCDVKPVAVFPDIGTALRTLHALPSTARMAEGWTLPQVLEHAAQSVEFSMSGFPELKPAWFSSSVGRLAFASFDARGRMNHGLSEPIPGAPTLATALPLADAVARLAKALRDFDAYGGALRPHFAYGALDKGAFARAHLMHLADHWQHYRAA